MKKWNYNDVYKKYDMNGTINIGKGTVKVHDIFNGLPEFMKEADCVFCDPPCSRGNLSTFYTKAELENSHDYQSFQNKFFECTDEIKPKDLFIEVFKSNKESFIADCRKRYKYVDIYESTYYFKENNICWIIHAHNYELKKLLPINNMDEEKIIEWITQNINYKCIGDFCMGRGLVGYYANKAGKSFVGTELNKKRLAILLDMINNNSMKGYH